MALHRIAILSCAALVALMLGAALLVRGGDGAGPFHVIETAATPTVEVAGLPAPSIPAARAERADLGQLATTALILLLMGALTVLVTLLGVIGAENLARKGRRVIEVMLGAPPRWLVGAAARLWRRRLLIAGGLGGGLCAGAAAWLVGVAPPRTGLAVPTLWLPAAVPLFIALLVLAAGVVPVWRLYARGRPLSEEAEQRHHTDPRPQQFNRILIIMVQLAIAVAILASSGLLLLSSASRPDLLGVAGGGARTGDGPREGNAGAGQTVVGRLASQADGATDSATRAGIYESALDALRDAPGLAAESLATPGAWMGRGPEIVAVNECGPCYAGGMPNPIHRARVQVHAVMPGFFAQRGMRFLAGGGFAGDADGPGTETGGSADPGTGGSADGGTRGSADGGMGDSADTGTRASPVPVRGSVVINEAYALAHFVNPIERSVALQGEGGEEVWYDVIGVVSDAPRGGLGNSGSAYAVYYSALAHPPAEIELVATVDVPPAAGLDDSLRVVRQALDAAPGGELVISDFRRADDELERVYGTAGWLGGGMRLAGVLAGLVALAGVMSTLRAHIRSRLREMGVRAALGAPPRTLRRMVLREALRLAATGTGLGLWVATFLIAFMSPNAVAIFSPPLFVGVAVLFIGSAVIVALPSGRLAASADPREVMEG